MMAPREVFSVTPFLYAFKRWFTFMGRTSTLPTILTTAQRYEHLLKYAIGKSLFVLHTAVVKYRNVIHVFFSNDIFEVADHRPENRPLRCFCRAAAEIF